MPMRRPLLLLLLAAVLASTGCSKISKLWKDDDKNEGQPVEVLYERGHDEMRNERWNSAAETYQRLVAQYPYGPYTEQALMETAYADFKAGKHDDAVSVIDRFIRTYPTHRNIAYFYYLRGLSNATRNTVFLQKVFSLQMSNRDLSTPMQAYNDFSIVVERYPNSRYAADAAQRMIVLRNLFAKHELDSSLYYLRRGANVAAQSARPTCWKPTRRASTRTTPSRCWPWPTPNSATRRWPPTPSACCSRTIRSTRTCRASGRTTRPRSASSTRSRARNRQRTTTDEQRRPRAAFSYVGHADVRQTYPFVIG